jgi:hypothetical protein
MTETKHSAKDIVVKFISAQDANYIMVKYHYSKGFCRTSYVHLGVFLDGKLEGAMSFGAPIDKNKTIIEVADTNWNSFLELNRMAFSDVLPRNSESRAMSVAFKLIKKQYPFMEWIISFSDACQCGDGTIYRAAGFHLIGVKKNKTMIKLHTGEIVSDKTLNSKQGGLKKAKDLGAKALEGYQIKYIYFLNKEAMSRLKNPILPFSCLKDNGIDMYKGKKREE